MKVIVDGDEIELGTTEAKPTIGIVDYSRRETDDFGVTTVVRRGFSRRMSVRAKVPFDQVDALQRTLADLRAQSVQWVADERFNSLSFVGFYKDFSIDLAVPPTSFCTLTVEGLAETEAGVDPGGDPAPDGRVSTLQLIQPAEITDSVVTASSVPEDDQPVWSAGTTYPYGARVMIGHRQWESLVVANIGNEPVEGSAQWMDIGPTNRWAMFDEALGTATEADDSIVVTLDPAAAVNSLALLDVTAATVRVQAAGYDRTIAPSAGAGSALFLDMPPTAGAITVTISGSGAVSVGTLLMGSLVGLGITGESPTAAINDYSRKETDDFGDVTVVERAWAKRMEATALLRTDAIDMVFNRIATGRGRPSLWIGAEGVEALSIYGFFKDFSIEVEENVSTLSLSIEGLSKAAPLALLDQTPYLVTVFQNAAEAPFPPPIDAGEVPPGWTLAPTDLPEGQYRWSTQAKFLLGRQQTAWTQPVSVAGIRWQDVIDDDPAHPKPEDGATVGATSEQAETIGHHTEQIEAALDDIHGLIETYGTTASAAASAAQAEAERIAAENAKTASIGARDDAEGFASAAEGSASVAHDAEVAAASSASLAAGYRADALDAASSASADADAAEVSKVAASGSSAAASASASLSASYATQAASRVAANIVAKVEFEDGAKGTWGAGGPADNAHLSIVTEAAGNYTKVCRSTNRDTYEWVEGNGGFVSFPKLIVGSRTFRVRGYAKAPGSFACNIGLQVQSASGSTNWFTGQAAAAGSTVYAAFDFQITVTAGYNRIRPFVQSNGAGGAGGHDIRWVGLSIEDVTDINVVSATATTASNAAAAANTAIATITQQVSAGNPNLAPGFDNFTADWQWNYGPWATVSDNWAGWGTHVYFDADTPANDWAVLETKNLIRVEGNAWYTLTTDARYNVVGAVGYFFVQFQWYAADGTTILGYSDTANAKNPNFDFSTDGTNRRALQTTRQAPATAAFCRIRCNWWRGSGAVTQRAIRQLKLERGQIATPFSQEARVYQTTAAAVDAQNRTRAYWQVNAAVPGSRAQLTVWADNAGAGVDIVGNVAISGNLVVDGTLNGNKIADLAVATAKIANQAVSKTVFAQLASPGVTINAGANTALYSTTFVKDVAGSDLEFEASVALTSSTTGSYNLWMRIYVDGNVSWFRRYAVPGQNAGSDFLAFRYRLAGLSAGSHTISFSIENAYPAGGGVTVTAGEGSNFQITEVKK